MCFNSSTFMNLTLNIKKYVDLNHFNCKKHDELL